MMIDTRRACQLIVGGVGFGTSVTAWAIAGHMALLGNWLPSSIMMCAAAWLLSVSERAIDRLTRRAR